MAQEAQSQSLTLAGTLDDTRNVGHDKRLLVPVSHDAEARLKCGEGVVGYLGTRTRQRREQSRLAGIGQAHQSNVGQQLQLQNDGHLLHWLAGLGIARSLIGGRAELVVAKTAATALEQHHHLAVVGHVAHELARLGIVDHSAAGHVDVDILAVGAMTLVATTVATMFGAYVALILQVEQRPVVVVATQIDVATASAVATVGSAVGIILHVAQVHRAASALSRAAVYLHIVNEITFHKPLS